MRIEGIARLIPHIGQPPSRAEAAACICEAVRTLTGSKAAALFLDEGLLARAAHSGFTLEPPDQLPASLADDELELLRAWGEKNGFDLVEVAPLRLADQILGALVLFGGPVEPLTSADLQLLGQVAACALEQARTLDEMRRAYDTQERTQAQVVRTERLRVLGEMALGIAHDFNNVLNAVLGQVGVIEVMAEQHAEIATPLDNLKQVAIEGARTVRRLQDFSRQRRDQEFADVDLVELARSAVASLRERWSEGPVVEERLPQRARTTGNAAELREALAAVLDNAVDSRCQHITVHVDIAGDEAHILVVDDGGGMSKEVRKRAFDPFFTTKGPLASGLGLSVAYGIVRRHGGRIELDSTPGQGTRVRLRLPALRSLTPPATPIVVTPGERRGLTVLLVEDDADNREAMSTLLGLGGHVVTATASGGEGVREFVLGRFDLVLTDFGLPDMTGWEVARQIKELDRDVPVALITGWGLNLALDEIRRRGVDILIKKPIEPRKFLEQLASIALPARSQIGG